MKRCPECRRDYYDDSLLYCLDDGSALLEGPASMDGPATAILQSGDVSAADAATQAQIYTTDQTAVLPSSGDIVPVSVGGAWRIVTAAFALLILVLGGFFGYRYFSSGTGQINSIAVLPFANASGDKEAEFLGDGISE